MTDTKQCEGCAYWTSVTGHKNALFFCHYMANNGKRRQVEDGVCMSYQRKQCKKENDDGNDQSEHAR